MKVIAKKQKESRRNDFEKIETYGSTFPMIHVVQNVNLPTQSIQNIRSVVDTKVLFVRKSMLQKQYPVFNFPESYFLVFAKENISSELEKMVYPSFLHEGEIASEQIVIPAGIIKDGKLASYISDAVPHGGNFVLEKDYMVCDKDSVISGKQANILQAMGKKMGACNLKVLAVKDSLK